MYSRFLHSENVLSLISSTDCGNSTDFKAVFEKLNLPILLSEDGNSIMSKFLHLKKV
jgi:hypothetical protein